MKQELKGWIMDTNFSTEEEKGQILRLESAGSIGLREVVEEMSREGTGLRPETLAHVVNLYQRVLTRLVLSGYSVNTGMFRLAPGFKGLVEGGVWDAERNSIRVTFTQGKELRRAIAQTPVKILGRRAEGIVILSGRDTGTGATDFTATAGRNYELRGRRLKVEGTDPSVGISLDDGLGHSLRLGPDMLAVNMPTRLVFLLPPDLPAGTYELTVTSQRSNAGKLLRQPRSASVVLEVKA